MCQINNYKNALPVGRLIPIVSNYPNEIVTLDLLGPYPVSGVRRNRYVLVITDHFSKWAEIIPLKKASARVIADNFFDNYISRFGAPIKLISDNGPQFISDIFENLSGRLCIRHVKTVVYRPQANRTERVNRDLVQMIANYVNEQHDTWDQFLREFAYAIRTAVNETTGKTPTDLFLGRKLITPFQKLVMVSDGTEFAVNDWVLVPTHPSATRKVVAKFKPKFEGPYGVLDIKNNNVVIWKEGKRLTINVDQVRIYRHRKCDETEIGTSSSENGNLRDESSGFDRVQRRSNESRDGKKKGSEVKRELEGKGLSFRNNQGGPERKVQKGSEHRVNKRGLSSNVSNSVLPRLRKKNRREETRGRRKKEDKFDPEKAEKGTIVHTSKSEEDQATRIRDEEVINNGKTRKEEERVQRSPCHWRSCHIKIMFDPSSFANPTPVAHADTSRDVLPRGGTSQRCKTKIKFRPIVESVRTGVSNTQPANTRPSQITVVIQIPQWSGVEIGIVRIRNLIFEKVIVHKILDFQRKSSPMNPQAKWI
ncbi:retrovirus-related Pol polyprotein from transposon 17.6 [Trichonephila clavipes]|nr:retrovirus-related Pol polyprotein from transposon 17.6 [Trichonephila clavipes]